MNSVVMRLIVGFLGGGVIIFGLLWLWWPEKKEYNFSEKIGITIIDDSSEFMMAQSRASTLQEFLQEQHISLQSGDTVMPPLETSLTSGMTLFISRQKMGEIIVGTETKSYASTLKTVEAVLQEEGVTVGEDDIVIPSGGTSLVGGMQIQVVRVTYSEEEEETKIPFKTEEKEDEELSWRKREVVQKGENGIRLKRFRVARHDGEVVSRKLLSEEVTKDPVTETVRQGTLVKTGKSHRGAASWYAHTGTLSAANPWLPLGSYVRVTNTENGKSVIVKINDRGPFGAGRIIDLDKVAFQEIASLGQGVVSVKMEEITN